MKTNIASIINAQYLSESRVRKQAEALVEKGYYVDVLALRSVAGEKPYSLKGVNVYPLPLRGKSGSKVGDFFQNCAFQFLSFFWITSLYIKKEYSVIHVNNMPVIMVCSTIIPKLCGAKIIFDIHNPCPDHLAGKPASKQLPRWLHAVVKMEERVGLAFADHSICTTDLVRDVVIKRGARPDKTSVVTNAPDTAIFHRLSPLCNKQPVAQKDSFVILYAGTVVEDYGLFNIVKALALLKNDIPGLKFKVIGSGEGMEDFLRLIHKLGMENVVELQPLKPVEEIPSEYEAADTVLWFPEQNDLINIIMSEKVLEAQTMGLPVISTKTECLTHYFTSNELTFVESTGISALASAVLDLYKHYEARKPTAEATALFVERFGWEHERTKYFNVIDRLTA